jgi:hypothetical protein
MVMVNSTAMAESTTSTLTYPYKWANILNAPLNEGSGMSPCLPSS